MADHTDTDTTAIMLAMMPKRVALNMKATPTLRDRIDKAAAKSGLSIAQEVERRLIASFDYEDAADYLRQRFDSGATFSMAGSVKPEALREIATPPAIPAGDVPKPNHRVLRFFDEVGGMEGFKRFVEADSIGWGAKLLRRPNFGRTCYYQLQAFGEVAGFVEAKRFPPGERRKINAFKLIEWPAL